MSSQRDSNNERLGDAGPILDDIPQHVRDRAKLVVADIATGREECWDLLEMLGLTPAQEAEQRAKAEAAERASDRTWVQRSPTQDHPLSPNFRGGRRVA